jgi:hypothetical protein
VPQEWRGALLRPQRGGKLSNQDDEVAENDAAHQDTKRGDFDITE